MNERNHYRTLGLAPDCTAAEIRAAYRALARACHPDLHPDEPAALARIQALNAAYAVLSDRHARRAHDAALDRVDAPRPARPGRARCLRHVERISFADLIRGVTLAVRVHDAGRPGARLTATLVIPPGTPPGARFRCSLAGGDENGSVLIRVQGRNDARFKARRCDLRCDWVIQARQAAGGGRDTLRGVTGQAIPVRFSAGVADGTLIRVPGEGLPRPRGGRGELLIRIRIAVPRPRALPTSPPGRIPRRR